jgi:hypothetical protein
MSHNYCHYQTTLCEIRYYQTTPCEICKTVGNPSFDICLNFFCIAIKNIATFCPCDGTMSLGLGEMVSGGTRRLELKG